LRKDQFSSVCLHAWADDKPDAYTSRNFKSTSVVGRKINEELQLDSGLGFKLSSVTQLGETNRYSYLFVPLEHGVHGSDDLLDPSRGNRVGLKLEPYADLLKTTPASSEALDVTGTMSRS